MGDMEFNGTPEEWDAGRNTNPLEKAYIRAKNI